MICKLFDSADEFTLEKLKSMIDNEAYLNKFKKIFGSVRESIFIKN